MTQDISITPFFISFDVIGGCIDIQTIYDHIKSVYKKEVFILNANDYVDSSSRHSSSKSSDGSHSRRSKSKNSSSNNSNSSTNANSNKEVEENTGTIQSGRGSRQSSSNTTSRPRDNSSRSVVKGFKARIESDLPKLIDNKRKFIAAQEKRKQQIEAGKNSHKKGPSSKNIADEKPKFDGQVDVIYIITNFPYLPKQLNALFEGGIRLDAFIAFKSSDFQPDKAEKIIKIEKTEKTDIIKPIETNEIPPTETIGTSLNSATKSSRSIDQKKTSRKSTVPGFALDYSNNPNSYPPVRWRILQSEAPVSVSFVEITVGPDAESTFKLVIEKVVDIQKSKPIFHEFVDGRRFIHLPSLESLSSPNPPFQDQDLTRFELFIEDNMANQNVKSSRGRFQRNRSGLSLNSVNSSSSLSGYHHKTSNPTVFVDALISQLKLGNWFPIPTQKPPGKKELINQMFKNKSQDATRKVIVYPQRKQIEPVFEYYKEEPKNDDSINVDFKKALPSVYEYLYKLIHWKLSTSNMYACQAWCDFLKCPDNFHAYSGQKFDLMFQRINKVYRLGLPLSFFEWKDWSLSIEHENVSEVLETAVEEADLVDTFFDEVAGLLFVLVMKPIPRNIGAFVPHVYMPLTMMVNSEWKTNFVENSESQVYVKEDGTLFLNSDENNESDNPPKKSRTPITPSFITKSFQNGPINSNLLYQLLPSLSDRFEHRENTVYKLPMYLTNTEEFKTPYFFEKSNMFVQTIRNCIYGKMTFTFKAFLNSNFQLTSSEDSISILPAENICFFFTFPFTVSIIFYQQSICYDSEKLTLKSSYESPIVVTKNGDLSFIKEGNIPLILKKDGTIGQMLQPGKWTYVNKEGETYKPRFSKKKGKMVNSKVDLPHSSYYDGSKGITTMIRPDGFDYIISNKGRREIIFKNDITVIQDDNKKTLYDIPSYPMIEHNKENESISVEIDKFKCIFKGKTAEIQCDEFSVIYKEGTILIKYNSSIINSGSKNNNILDSEVFITETTVAFKSGEKDVLFASKDGTERKGELLIPDQINGENNAINNKKKLDTIDTHWGKLLPIKDTYTEAQQMELHRIFSPRFFVIRSDLSATQYFRPDVINMEDYRPYRKTILHPSGDKVNIVTFHREEQLPFLFIENKTLTKIDRVNLLKLVHIPKPPKKKKEKKNEENNEVDDSYQKVFDEAINAHNNMNQNSRRFQILLTRTLARSQDKFLDDIMPPPPPPKEIIRVPPATPPPRLLEMQHNLYDLTSTGRYNYNYWQCNESEFGFPIDEQHRPETPLSPRTKLLDPPRLFKPEKKSNLNVNKITNPNSNLSRPITPMSNTSSKKVAACISRPFSAGFATQKFPTTMICPEIENKEILKPKVAQLSKNKIDLGTVFIGESKTGELTVKNITLKPLRYNLSQFKLNEKSSNVLRVLTIPGVITPGLSIPVKIMLEAKCVENIDTFFEFRTPFFSSKIQVTAVVVANPKSERKKKKVKKYPDVINDINDYEYAYEYEEEEEEAKDEKENIVNDE